MLPENSKLNGNDSRQYILMLQDIINRMAKNSSNCKAWTITLVTAMMALVMNLQEARLLLITLLPIVIFFFLDLYYLGLENDFRNLQAEYVEKLKSDVDCTDGIYKFDVRDVAANVNNANLKKAFISKSTWPMYLVLFVIVLVLALIKKPDKKQNLEVPLKEIAFKQDSIVSSINRLTDKYKPTPPVHVATKTFINSSFFSADNVDSVQVNVYGNKMKLK